MTSWLSLSSSWGGGGRGDGWTADSCSVAWGRGGALFVSCGGLMVDITVDLEGLGGRGVVMTG